MAAASVRLNPQSKNERRDKEGERERTSEQHKKSLDTNMQFNTNFIYWTYAHWCSQWNNNGDIHSSKRK